MKKNILIFLFTLFYSTNNYACKCESIDDIKKEFYSTELIIHAKIISKENISFLKTLNKNGKKLITNSYGYDKNKFELINNDLIVKIKLEVLHIYKGDNVKKQITIYTSRMSSNCGYKNFEVGKEFQIYLSKSCNFDFVFKNANLKAKNYKGYWTNVCTRTKQFSTEEDKMLKSFGIEQ